MSTDIDQIKQRLDIVELLQEYLPNLRKLGANWKAPCPFHNEKTPSFVVSPEKQIWHCFGCDRGGDIFTFVQEIESIEFSAALQQLAKRAGVELQQHSPQETTQHNRLIECIQAAQQFYENFLHTQPAAQVARDYLTQRGIKMATQQQFGLGYSPPQWDALLQALRVLGFTEQEMFLAGVIIKKDQGAGYYDRFRDRIMFPFYDINGLVVGFTARALNDTQTSGGKYINSPQSELYDKSKIIYGLHLAKSTIKRVQASIIVEGNVDVITAHQAGFTNVVATSGTAFTEYQITFLKRYAPNLLIAFDMDAAGTSAAQRSIDNALQQEMNVKVIQLSSQYKDPDECIRQDPAAFKTAIRNALHVMDFYFYSLLKPLDLNRVEHKKKAVQLLLPHLKKLRNPVEQAHFIQKLADAIQIDLAIIQQQLKNFSQPRSYTASKPNQTAAKTQAAPTNRFDKLSRQTLGLLLNFPEQLPYCIEYLAPEYLTDAQICELYKRIVSYYNNTGSFVLADYLETLSSDQHLVNSLLLFQETLFPNIPPVTAQDELIKSLRELHNGYIRRRLHKLEFELKQAEHTNQQAEVDRLVQELQLLTQELTELSK